MEDNHVDRVVSLYAVIKHRGGLCVLEKRLSGQLLDYLCFRWKDDIHEADMHGLDLHRRLRFETWLLGGAFFLRDDAMEEELMFLHNIACTIREMLSNPEDGE